MTSAEIRQSFLDFFKSKVHTIVPSSSLMPDSPNLLFTNAGMNQFVPIFLGQRNADVDTWSGAIKGSSTRAADTQKCIRAGGKHNDLDDVGLDTYHHTFFEMLGNWSFGDYFKKEAISWAWELVVDRWKFPPQRLYATVYMPDKSKGDPSDFDQEAHDFWAEKFRAAGLDPAVHIVNGNKKDNFWMMGDTGPCGPCSELHVDLTQNGDTQGRLVNAGNSECIEIWNLVFIQFNANPDGTFSPLPAKHVDTGMGFERVTSILQCTQGFKNFGTTISNYETDIFRPIFDELEKMSGKKYASTLPKPGSTGDNEQEKIDVAFRVIADHIRTLSFAIADGIQPGNTDRNYVLRRILRRAVRYGRTLGFHQPFFYKLTAVLARTMGVVFPEVRTKQKHIEEVLKREEEAFNKTLDTGIRIFEDIVVNQNPRLELYAHSERLLENCTNEIKRWLSDGKQGAWDEASVLVKKTKELADCVKELASTFGSHWEEFATLSRREKTLNNDENLKQGIFFPDWHEEIQGIIDSSKILLSQLDEKHQVVSGKAAFALYDTYGFPFDLTELMARERGLAVDRAGFEKLMEEQRTRARAAQKKQVIELSQIDTKDATHFFGYDHAHTGADVQEVVALEDKTAVVLNNSVLYAEMGGQVGDTGQLSGSGKLWPVVNTQKNGNTWLHFIEGEDAPNVGEHVTVEYDTDRRGAIQRHHTVTHLLHWALHEVVSREASQKGSFVGPDKLTFDFNSAPLTHDQVRDVERLVNERIVENAGVSWTELPYSDVKSRPNVMQFFGDKYGDVVRVVQIGGSAAKLDGYSMELCGGTHTRATGEIGLFRIVSEAAIAAGVRRIEAVAGLNAYDFASTDSERLKTFATKLNAPLGELEKKLDALLAHQKELEKSLKAAQQREAAGIAKDLLANAETVNGMSVIVAQLGAADGDALQSVADALKGSVKGVVVLGGVSNGAVSLVASVSPDFTSKIQAGKIIQQIAPIVGGKGGGKPDNARGGGKDAAKLDEALAKAKSIIAV